MNRAKRQSDFGAPPPRLASNLRKALRRTGVPRRLWQTHSSASAVTPCLGPHTRRLVGRQAGTLRAYYRRLAGRAQLAGSQPTRLQACQLADAHAHVGTLGSGAWASRRASLLAWRHAGTSARKLAAGVQAGGQASRQRRGSQARRCSGMQARRLAALCRRGHPNTHARRHACQLTKARRAAAPLMFGRHRGLRIGEGTQRGGLWLQAAFTRSPAFCKISIIPRAPCPALALLHVQVQSAALQRHGGRAKHAALGCGRGSEGGFSVMRRCAGSSSAAGSAAGSHPIWAWRPRQACIACEHRDNSAVSSQS